MSSLAKLCVCVAAGAIIGGGAVKVADRPAKVKPSVKSERIEFPCDPLIITTPQMQTALDDFGVIELGDVPNGVMLPSTPGNEVPEPPSSLIFLFGVTAALGAARLAQILGRKR